MPVDIRVENDSAQRLARDLSAMGARGKRMIRSAVNETGRSVRTNVSKRLREVITLKSSEIRDQVSLRRAGDLTNPTASVTLRRKPVPLIRFQVRPRQPDPKRKLPVLVKVYQNRPAERDARAFVARMASGHVGVFRRMGRGRLPIVEKTGPTPLGVFENEPGIERTVLREADEKLTQNLSRKLDFLLRGVGRA